MYECVIRYLESVIAQCSSLEGRPDPRPLIRHDLVDHPLLPFLETVWRHGWDDENPYDSKNNTRMALREKLIEQQRALILMLLERSRNVDLRVQQTALNLWSRLKDVVRAEDARQVNEEDDGGADYEPSSEAAGRAIINAVSNDPVTHPLADILEHMLDQPYLQDETQHWLNFQFFAMDKMISTNYAILNQLS